MGEGCLLLPSRGVPPLFWTGACLRLSPVAVPAAIPAAIPVAVPAAIPAAVAELNLMPAACVCTAEQKEERRMKKGMGGMPGMPGMGMGMGGMVRWWSAGASPTPPTPFFPRAPPSTTYVLIACAYADVPADVPASCAVS
jgi:hypothetical protein